MNNITEWSSDLKELLTIPHTIKEYDKDTYLFRDGDTINSIFLVQSGKVQIGKVTPDGRELTLRICGPHQLVGEITLFSPTTKYLLDAKALETVQCVKITVDAIEDALLYKPEIAITLMKWMGLNHQKTQTRFRDLLLHGKKGALFSTLIRMSNSYGVEHETGILIDKVFTNQELANFCGMAREVVNRVLSELKKEGHISMWEGKIIIHDLAHLKNEIKCEDCPIAFCRID
ncbi:MAG TPA: Crp/Fnr family transcriptional regulator [Paenisporosarcina sp.]|nr:Crp/Fnr family transcriptional regulator [Paenisporosarcina sp.]